MSIQLASILAGTTAIGRIGAGFVLKRIKWYRLLNVCVIAMGALVLLALPMAQNIGAQTEVGWATAPIAAYVIPMMGLLMAPIYPVINSVALTALPKTDARGDDRPHRRLLRARRNARLVHHRAGVRALRRHPRVLLLAGADVDVAADAVAVQTRNRSRAAGSDGGKSCVNLTRRDFLAASAARPLSSTARPARATDKRRSVLLIVADDLGSDIGCYGGWIRSPNLDALAKQGTLFTDAYAAVSSCSSSRATLYTGLYPHTNGMYGLSHDVHNFSLLENVKTLPWMLKQSGYATALVGKLHVKPEALLAYDAWLLPEQAGNRDVAAMGHAAGKWIRESKDRPFFLTVGYSDPHRAGDASQFGNTRDWPEVKRDATRRRM